MEQTLSISDLYLPLIITISVALILAFVLTHASALVGPSRPNKIKNSVYESGMDPVGGAHERFAVKFYMVSMLFILFDIEVVFMFPWAVQYKELALEFGILPLVEMATFVLVLFVGYIYVVKKGALDWEN